MIISGIGIPVAAENNDFLRERSELKDRIERRYESQIIGALAGYFDRNRFFVNVTVALEEVQVPTRFEVPRFREEPLDLRSLPGLPIVPEGLQRRSASPQDTLIPTGFETVYQLDYMEVEVFVDDIYTQEEVNFIESRIRSVVSLDENRGDLFIINQIAFPDRERIARLEEEADDDDADEMLTQEEFDAALAEMMEEFMQQQEEVVEAEQAAMFSRENPALPWFIAVGILVLILLGLLIYLLVRNLRKYPGGGTEESSALSDIKNELERIKNGDSTGNTTGGLSENDKIGPDDLNRFESDKMYLTNQFISNPEGVADALHDLHKKDPENGIMKSARAVQAVNHRLLSTLRGIMEPELLDRIGMTIEHLEPMSTHESMQEASGFKEYLRSRNRPDGEQADRKSDMFRFLRDLSDDQLFNLFKDEKDAIVAIALAQLDGQRTGNILNRMDQERRTAIMVKMGKLESIPAQSFKQVADHLVKQALEIANMKYVASDGVQSVLNILDSLPVSEQKGYMDTIARQDLDLAEKIRRYFVSFEDIPELEEVQLQSALDRVDTGTVVKALIDAPDAVARNIISMRSPREQRLIESEINRSQEVTLHEIDAARKEILSAIRNVKRAALS